MRSDNRVSLVALAALLVVSSTASGEIGQDTHIQETGEVRIEVDSRVFEEFARLFDLGYPPATVMMHAVSTGMSINDILYIAVKSDLSRAQEFYDTANSLLPALPGWVCQAGGQTERYTRTLGPDELGDDPTILRVAQSYFESGKRVVPFPDWSQGRVHMQARVSELVDLVGDEQWYVAGRSDGSPRTVPNRPVFVSLYKHNESIVVDSGIQRIQRAAEQGRERLPVVLVYNNRRQRPISAFGRDATLGRLAEAFYADGIELTAVPEWQVGDHHKKATPEELGEIIEVPDREDISEDRWETLEQEIRNNGMELSRPLLMTLVRSGQGRAWLDDPAKVAVASELGMSSLPVVLFYHRLDRRPCGEPSNCGDLLCEAATAAGASGAVCDAGGETSARAMSREDGALPGARPRSADLEIDTALYQGLAYTQKLCPS